MSLAKAELMVGYYVNFLGEIIREPKFIDYVISLKALSLVC